MAGKYEYMLGCYAWNLDKCEEEVFIAGYLEISAVIPPGQIWQRRLEYYFFERGEGLAFESLNEVNAVRVHHGLERIEIGETRLGDYALSRDKAMKSQRRCQIRTEFKEANAEVRAPWLAQAKAEEEHLPPRHYPDEEFELQPRSEKHANFQRLAAQRMEQIREAYRKFGNLSASNYEFTQSEVAKMFDTFRDCLEEAFARFQRRLK
jgi:hypothetical protein